MRVVLLTCAVLGGCSLTGTGALIDLLGTGSVDEIDVRGIWNGAVHGPDRSAARAPIADLTPLPDPACTAGARCPYAYRRRITITNGGGTTLGVGYTVRLPLPTLTGKIRGDFNDLRVFKDVPNTELNRIVDAAPPG